MRAFPGDADFLVGPLFADAVDDLSGEEAGELSVVQAVVEVPAGEAVTEHEAVAGPRSACSRRCAGIGVGYRVPCGACERGVTGLCVYMLGYTYAGA